MFHFSSIEYEKYSFFLICNSLWFLRTFHLDLLWKRSIIYRKINCIHILSLPIWRTRNASRRAEKLNIIFSNTSSSIASSQTTHDDRLKQSGLLQHKTSAKRPADMTAFHRTTWYKEKYPPLPTLLTIITVQDHCYRASRPLAIRPFRRVRDIRQEVLTMLGKSKPRRYFVLTSRTLA